MLTDSDRRTFLTTLAGLAGLAALGNARGPPAGQAPAPVVAGPIDISWFDAFKGKHKQVFDLGSFDLSVDSPLRQPGTYFAAHRQVSKLEPPNDVNVLIAISHKAFPMNASDALWE